MYINRPSRIILVQTLVLSIINYCLRIWGTTNITIINDVQKLQNFTARVAIGGIRKCDHITPALKELGWLKVNEKHLFDPYSLVYKVINKFYPPWLKCYMTVREVTASTTRQHNDLHFPKQELIPEPGAWMSWNPLHGTISHQTLPTQALIMFLKIF